MTVKSSVNIEKSVEFMTPTLFIHTAFRSHSIFKYLRGSLFIYFNFDIVFHLPYQFDLRRPTFRYHICHLFIATENDFTLHKFKTYIGILYKKKKSMGLLILPNTFQIYFITIHESFSIFTIRIFIVSPRTVPRLIIQTIYDGMCICEKEACSNLPHTYRWNYIFISQFYYQNYIEPLPILWGCGKHPKLIFKSCSSMQWYSWGISIKLWN